MSLRNQSSVNARTNRSCNRHFHVAQTHHSHTEYALRAQRIRRETSGSFDVPLTHALLIRKVAPPCVVPSFVLLVVHLFGLFANSANVSLQNVL